MTDFKSNVVYDGIYMPLIYMTYPHRRGLCAARQSLNRAATSERSSRSVPGKGRDTQTMNGFYFKLCHSLAAFLYPSIDLC